MTEITRHIKESRGKRPLNRTPNKEWPPILLEDYGDTAKYLIKFNDHKGERFETERIMPKKKRQGKGMNKQPLKLFGRTPMRVNDREVNFPLEYNNKSGERMVATLRVTINDEGEIESEVLYENLS